jgi:hypothetical protein
VWERKEGRKAGLKEGRGHTIEWMTEGRGKEGKVGRKIDKRGRPKEGRKNGKSEKAGCGWRLRLGRGRFERG